MHNWSTGEKGPLPDFFRPILWSYNFSKLDPEKNKKRIIINSVNYGSLRHWRWIARRYGKPAIREVLETVPVQDLRLRARELAAIIFSVKRFNYAPRGTPR